MTVFTFFSALFTSAGDKLLTQLFLLHSCLRRSRGADVGAAKLSFQSSSVVVLPLPVDERDTTFLEVVLRLFRIRLPHTIVLGNVIGQVRIVFDLCIKRKSLRFFTGSVIHAS